MKIIILTWCYSYNHINYGEILQCYALQRICKKLGHEPLVLRYRNYFWDEDIRLVPEKSNSEREAYETDQKHRHAEIYDALRVDQVLEFLEENINFSKQCYNIDEVIEETKNADILLVGSDQLWNPNWLDEVYLLNFEHKGIKGISYATGGISIDSSENREILCHIAKSIEKFNHVSVREPITKQILSRYIEKEMVDLLDPTLLFSREEWDELCGDRIVEDKYVFAFYIGRISSHKHIIKAIKKKRKADKVIYLNMNNDGKNMNELEHMSAYENVGPKEFISLIKYADSVCTDSFHCFVFSLIYHKDFYLMKRVYTPQQDSSGTRWDNLMDKLGIKKRYANSKSEIELLEEIDYDSVEKKLKFLRRNSITWLKTRLAGS